MLFPPANSPPSRLGIAEKDARSQFLPTFSTIGLSFNEEDVDLALQAAIQSSFLIFDFFETFDGLCGHKERQSTVTRTAR